MKRTMIVGSVGVAILLSGGAWLLAAPHQAIYQKISPLQLLAAAAPTIGTPTATPNAIALNTPTPVTVSVRFNDPTLIPSSVNLLRLGAAGTQPTVMGTMHDDGLKGDDTAADNIYTLQVLINEPVVAQIQFQVSAAFRGTLKRVLSGITTVQINAPVGLSQFTDLQAHIAILYPTGSQILKDGPTTNFYDVNYPDLPATMEIELFTPQVNTTNFPSQILTDIARLRLGEDFDGVDHFTGNGVVVRGTTLYVLYFYAYDVNTNQALELRARSPDFFSSPAFQQISNSVSFVK